MYLFVTRLKTSEEVIERVSEQNNMITTASRVSKLQYEKGANAKLCCLVTGQEMEAKNKAREYMLVCKRSRQIKESVKKNKAKRAMGAAVIR